MKMDFRDKTVVIVGGDDAVGSAAALAFARMGAHIFVCGGCREGMERLSCSAWKEQLTVAGTMLAMTDDKALEGFLKNVDGNAIDVLVCNGHTEIPRKPATQLTAEEWDTALDGTLRLDWKAAILALPRLRAKEGSSIVFVTTAGVRHPSLLNGISAVCSAGVESMTKTLSSEIASSHIRVNAVAAGDTAPENGCAMSSVAAGEDVAGTILFLASDAASYCTGTMVEVSGSEYLLSSEKNSERGV
jgi:NAD(P)-dependent dehydrogenase (short-subunit alcohol dehydrogenase family)